MTRDLYSPMSLLMSPPKTWRKNRWDSLGILHNCGTITYSLTTIRSNNNITKLEFQLTSPSPVPQSILQLPSQLEHFVSLLPLAWCVLSLGLLCLFEFVSPSFFSSSSPSCKLFKQLLCRTFSLANNRCLACLGGLWSMTATWQKKVKRQFRIFR